MIKTLHVTGVVAVVLAVVVVASVLGVLRPGVLLRLDGGDGPGDKQVAKILGAAGAVARFKEQHAGQVPPGGETVAPLVKQAELLANTINPPALPDTPAAVLPARTPMRATPLVKPAQTSTKFDLLGISCSSNPQASLAYIRLPDGAYQWVGPGSEIGHVTVKEIRRDSIICFDGHRDSEMPVMPPPETSRLLETEAASTVSVTPATSSPRPALEGKPLGSPIKPPVTLSRPTTPLASMPSAQISKEEQQALGDLGNRLKAGAAAGDRDATEKLIANFKAARGQLSEEPAVEADGTTDGSIDSARVERRREFMMRFNKARQMQEK
ncbi:MAG: hypothetical protein MUC88_11335 [Planctomycetes bacterium]|jgi:hypothetical protein|nr:hypothetical protein [Planctomycetota bacterium]